jgi:peptidase E
MSFDPEAHPHRAHRELELRILIQTRFHDLNEAISDAQQEGCTFGASAGAMMIHHQIEAWQAEYRDMMGWDYIIRE